MGNDGEVYLRLSGAHTERALQCPIEGAALRLETILIVILQPARSPTDGDHMGDLRNIDGEYQSRAYENRGDGKIPQFTDALFGGTADQIQHEIDDETDAVVYPASPGKAE